MLPKVSASASARVQLALLAATAASIAWPTYAAAARERCEQFMQSQVKQDQQVLEILSVVDDIAPTYVDLAANHYMRISNTFMLDKCLGWKGVCIEPNDAYYGDLLKHRTCDVYPVCVSDDFETVTFIIAHVFGGIESTNKNLNGESYWQKGVNATTPRKTMECAPLWFLLKRSNVQRVGYMSLDVEGHELKVLQGINWRDVEIDIISLEPNDMKAVEFIKDKGFVKYKDEMYVSARVNRLLNS
jgi:FkbM family methyltransferase